jgi:hypothetical protein
MSTLNVNNIVTQDNEGDLVFQTNNTTQMILTSAGTLSGAGATAHTLSNFTGTGKLVQVVQSEYGSQDISMTGTSNRIASRYVVSITPTLATSKVLVSFMGKARGASAQFSQWLYSEVPGTSAAILSAGWSDHSAYGQGTNLACQYLHSPNTTSEVSYKLYFSAATGTVQVGMEYHTIVGIAMEIGA